MHRVVCAIALPLLAATAFAHTVTTTDGKTYEGKVISQDDDKVVIETTFDGSKTIPRAEVKSVNTTVPPLREQLQYRADKARDDVKALWKLHTWARKKGFKKELEYILRRIIDLAPENKRARKMLGHEEIDGQWISPEEKEAYLQRKHDEAMRAKGLVKYEGDWVTPEERDAREKGLIKDGDEWVTEEEYHKRRGEQLVDGKWVKVGLEEGKAWAGMAAREARLKLAYRWSPHFDAVYEVSPALAQRCLDASEKAYAVMRRVLKPTPEELGENLQERIKLALFKKVPAYARFAKWLNGKINAEELVPGWVRAVQRQHSFWWAQDVITTGVYQFPNTDKTFASNVLHGVGQILLTRYRLNYKLPSFWLLQGFAYYLELEATGYTLSFTLGRGGTGAGMGAKGPIWGDSAQWKPALKALVAEGRDPPLKRIARMSMDQFRYEELVKSWSVVEYLITLDRAKFKKFINGTKDRDKEEKDALREAYGLTYRELDRKWRAYVSSDFKHAP